jgi:hypothetical protein
MLLVKSRVPSLDLREVGDYASIGVTPGKKEGSRLPV